MDEHAGPLLIGLLKGDPIAIDDGAGDYTTSPLGDLLASIDYGGSWASSSAEDELHNLTDWLDEARAGGNIAKAHAMLERVRAARLVVTAVRRAQNGETPRCAPDERARLGALIKLLADLV